MKQTRYQEGLNDFEYCVSFHVSHPSIDPQLVSEALGIVPERSTRVGAQRCTPNGRPLKGTYDYSHWWVKLDVIDNARLAESLALHIKLLQPAGEFLRQIVDEGGEAELFVGLYATRLCDSALPCSLLGDLANLGIGLRLDYYNNEKIVTSES